MELGTLHALAYYQNIAKMWLLDSTDMQLLF
jgi:hypothetical protein